MEKDINELKEVLSDLKKIFDEKENTPENAKKMFYELLNRAINEPCEISIKKEKNGYAQASINGERLSLIVTLIGLEREVLNKLKCPKEEYEFIKTFIGSKEAE